MSRDRIDNPDRFTALFENATDAIAAVRLEAGAFIVTEVNSAFEATFGYDAETITGEDIDEFVLPEGGDSRSIGGAMRAGERVEREVKRKTATGIRDFLVRTAPFELDDGWPGGYVIYIDISEQKRRERLLERYETILDVLADPVFTVDEASRFTFVNDAFCDMVERNREAILGAHVTDVIEQARARRFQEHAKRLREREPGAVERYELTVDVHGGRERVFETHLTLLPTAESLVGVAGVLLDITARREQAERLETLASVVSHDLRNPLQVAHARVETAMQSTNAEQRETLAESRRALEQMDALINDLLSVAREGEEAFAPEAVDLTAIARDAATGIRTGDSSIDVRELGSVIAEETQVLQLFSNLFRNAIDHGGESVTVRVEPIPGGFAVVDDGPGLPPDAETDVFRRGYSTSEAGTGVGLTIVERVADIHGWDVRARNDPTTGGARFEFTGL